jgi:hypothetical protein
MQDRVTEPIEIGFAVIEALFHGCTFNQVGHVSYYATAFAFGVSLNRFNYQFLSHS